MGRVDALVAGPAGVPQPQDDLASFTASFRRQGFTPTEMIGLVACGHTFGGVRTPDFPDIVPATANGSILVEPFDSTPKFDNAVYV
jgi:catalase (peroxidase I)